MTTDLDTLIGQTLSEYQQYQQQKAAKKEEEKQAKMGEAAGELTLLLEQYLSSEFCDQVKIAYHHEWDSYYGYRGVEARFRYQDDRWTLSYSKDRNYADKTTWRIECNGVAKDSGIESKSLQVMLLVELGKQREEKREAREKREQRLRESEEQEARYKEVEAQRAQEQVCRIAEANAMHERLLARITEERKQAEQDLWRWPEGVTIEVYELTYCTGGYRDEDGSLSCDYTTGWTDVSHLDVHGRITLQPQKRYSWRNDAESPRVVQLVMEIHKPVWEVHHYSSIEELPETLREKVTVSFPHIVERRNADLYEDRLVESTDTDYDGNWYTETIGEVPLPWIQELVDKQDVLDAIRR